MGALLLAFAHARLRRFAHDRPAVLNLAEHVWRRVRPCLQMLWRCRIPLSPSTRCGLHGGAAARVLDQGREMSQD
jgi:hypothetical protein